MPAIESKVTVVIASHNHSHYLSETIKSILDQSVSCLELVFVDNDSSDNSYEIASGFKDERLKISRQQNLGLSVVLNEAVSKSSSEWIALCGPDDIWHKNKLEIQLEALANDSEYGACFSQAVFIDDSGNELPEEMAKSLPFISYQGTRKEDLYKGLFFKSNFLLAPSVLIRREILQTTLFDNSLLQLQDFDMWINLAKRTSVLILEEKLLKYRIREQGENLSLKPMNRSRILFELSRVYNKFFDDVSPEFFYNSFFSVLKNKNIDLNNKIQLKAEQAFLYLSMGEPAIKFLGINMLYELFKDDLSSKFMMQTYNFSFENLWQTANNLIFADSQAIAEESNKIEYLQKELQKTQVECSDLKITLAKITKSRFWRLRQYIYGLVGES